jgi:hypothetical protein
MIQMLADMRPAMLDTELALFESVVACSKAYAEFGCGGSTAYAAHLVADSVTSVESSLEWLEKTQTFCMQKKLRVKPHFVHTDIGLTRTLGYPADDSCMGKWPNYHTTIWTSVESLVKADTYLIDGRFRVACFMQAMLHTSVHGIVLMHDYANRPEYHVIAAFARELARADNLSVFQRASHFDEVQAAACLANYAHDPR